MLDYLLSVEENKIYLMDNPAECKRLSENAHNLVYDYCDYSNVIWKLEEIMKS